MAKQQSFADKAMKGQMIKGRKCPVCGQILQPVLLVSSEKAAGVGQWKFNEHRVQVCKCNEKEVYA
jgi:hypothetical protein